MKNEDIANYDYDLPEELIAQTPLKDRSSSRLLVLDRKTSTYEDKHFSDILDYIAPGDVLVINDTKVIPARIIGIKEDTGAHIELLLLKELGNEKWECLARPCKRLKRGTVVNFGDGLLRAQIVDILGDGVVHAQMIYEGIFMEILEKLGTMPLPPYIHEELKDQTRYQTVYAEKLGSAAAPTAGLHFTEELLKKAKNKGIRIAHVTLHVGLGTFRPVDETDITKHKMHSEHYILDQENADILNEARVVGRKIYAVGTTSVRTLETVMNRFGTFKETSGDTDIFIYPGYEFKSIDGLITNFHLPKSTLIMLVSAFAGREFVLECYRHAVQDKYRFFSFGDAMLIK